MKKSIFVAKTEIIRTLRQSQTLMVVIFLAVLYESILSPMKSLCYETSFTLHFSEPFILMCTKSTNIILIPIVYLFVLSGFPYCGAQYFQMIRTGKRNWLCGELIFIVLSSFVITLIIFLGSMLFMTEYIYPHESWSDFMTLMFRNYPQKYAENILLFLNASTIAHGEPVGILIYTFAIMWAYLAICGIGLLLGAIFKRRTTALTLCVAITAAGGICTYFPGKLKWIFPLLHLEYGEHYNYVFSQIFFPVWGSILYFCVILAALIAACFWGIQKMRVGDDL